MSVEHVSLARCRVLYLGSAIPLETAVGIESIQTPCRDRFANNVDGDQRASGIDSVLSVYSSGLMLQYAADSSSTTWFPIQTLHVCAAVKAVSGSGPLRFVSLDTTAAQRSNNPPMFAAIMRRTKGIKVLECHVFICKSTQAAMALVQACTHAFQHKEGWLSSMPASGTRIVSAEDGYKGGKAQSFATGRSDLVQKFDVSCRLDDCEPKAVGPVVPVMKPGMAGMGGYFADWNTYGGQPMMIVPTSPFYPGLEQMNQMKCKKKKKKKKECSSDEEEEVYYVRKPAPKPCPPQIILVPQPQPQQPAKPPETSFKNQQNPKTDVVVYAPQVITANRKSANFNYDDRDNEVVDYHPDGRRFLNNNERRLLDARQDNHVDYQRGYYSKNDYRADQRTFYNQENWEAGYYDAQLEDYNAQVLEYNQQLADYYCDDGDDGYDDDYCAQPGYTDDCGVGDYVRYAEEPRGRYVLDYVDDYVVDYGQPTVVPTAARDRYVQVADGLGYYP